LRTFIALELSTAVWQALAAIQGELRPHLPQARWTRPDGTHLTLKFLGEAHPDQVERIKAELHRISLNYNPFDLGLNGVGAFPRPAAPRVLWVGIQLSPELKKLQIDVETAISPLGFPSEKRDFRPHLTLARLPGESWSPDLRQHFLECSALASGIAWPVHRLILFKSDLLKGGAVYTPLQLSEFQLKSTPN
jgi:2'-5' RNA ligase